jgi:hypothetical protein
MLIVRVILEGDAMGGNGRERNKKERKKSKIKRLKE